MTYRSQNSLLRYSFLIIIAAFILASCTETKRNYVLMYSPDEPIGEISAHIEDIIETHTIHTVERIISEGSIANLDSLKNGTADLAIVENFIPFEDSIKTVLKLYPQILHIFYLSDTTITSLDGLLYDKDVFIGLPGSGSYRFMMILFDYFQLDKSRINVVDNAFVNDVIAGFIDIISQDQLQGLESFKLFSFDQIAAYGQGSVVEGIALRYPQVRPFVIPSGTYASLNRMPIVTLATDAILVARATMSEDEIYQITKAIFNDKQELTGISPLIQKGLTEHFDRSELSFPLHEGARIFFDRDEPSPLERYAELSGVIFSVLLALISGIITFLRWHSQRKKDRVDIFYQQLMDIKIQLPKLRHSVDGLRRIKEIHDAQHKAFQMLINEELSANESFRIYMELSKETVIDIKNKVKILRAHDR
jgi:TRAP-type uncharacterized transport system substrate-binding protein